MSTFSNPAAQHFEVRFASLFRPGRALSFPCDERGRVDLDILPAPARRNYLVAREQVGREYAVPQVHAATLSRPS